MRDTSLNRVTFVTRQKKAIKPSRRYIIVGTKFAKGGKAMIPVKDQSGKTLIDRVSFVDRQKKAIGSANYTIVKPKFAEGGEAIIDLVKDQSGKTLILKRFRTPDDPVFVTEEQKTSASLKLKELAAKLAAFPKLSNRVITPLKTVLNPDRTVFGYTMEYLDHSFQLSELMSTDGRAKHGMTLNQITEIFLELYDIIMELHKKGVVIGDLKPENILIRNLKVHIIDSESMQFGKFMCHAYSDEWIDPRLCKDQADYLLKNKNADKKSDWYTFASMFFSAISGISPYAGTAFTVKGIISETTRKLKGISVFTKGVRIPPFALKPEFMNEDLARYFKRIFSNSEVRGRPDRRILESLVWKSCTNTEREFSAKTCPCGKCSSADIPESEASITPAIYVSDFPVKGRVLASSLSEKNTLNYLQYSKDGAKILKGPSKCIGKLEDPSVYSDYWLSDNAICMLSSGTLFIKYSKDLWKLKITDSDNINLPKVSIFQNTIAALTPNGVSLLELSSGKNKENLKGGNDLKGVWLTSSDSGIGVGVTNNKKIEIKIMANKCFIDLKGMPDLFGTLEAANVYSSKNACWIVVRLKDRSELSDYIFCLDAHNFNLKAYCKTDNLLIDDFFEKAMAFNSSGTEYLYSRYNTPVNAYKIIGSKILPSGVKQLREIGDNSIVRSHNGDLYVFNPVAEH